MNTALLFPGQGAQTVGMGRELAETDPACRALFDRANEVLGFDLTSICFDGPDDQLTRSNHAQPAIFLVSAAAHAALLRAKPNLQPSALAGLSSGEWAALYVAGVVTFDDVLRVLEARGRFMQAACGQEQGGMLSVIGLTVEQLQPLAHACGVQLANLNSPEQTVLSGRIEGIEKAEEAAKAAGAKRALRLNVAGAFHSELMQPAARELATFLEDVPMAEPQIPVISNVTGKPFESAARIRALMVRQVTESVRWVDTIQQLRQSGIDTVVECGPGKVLSGLVKRIDKQCAIYNIQDNASLAATAEHV